MFPEGPSGFTPDPRIAEYPGTMIRDWIMLCPEIPDSAYRAYSVIRAHIWEKDTDRTVTLTQAQIAAMIGKSEERTRKILKPLLAVGLLTVAEKREWWEHNPRLNRRERRTMNIYAVTDFPPADYDGPKSISDFKVRFARQSATDRSDTTGRGAGHVSAGQTDRSKTTGGSSSQVSDVSAGQTDRSKMTSREVKNDRPYKNLSKKEGEEGDARARAMGEPSPVDEPQWGVAGGAGFAAPSLASAELIREIAGRVLLPGEGLTAADHQRLAMLAEAARPLVDAQPGLSWEEYTAWLKQGWVRPDGRRTFKSLPGALGWRLLPEQIRGQAWAWACEQRGAQEPSGARGGREVPPGGVQVHAGVCGRHKVALTDDGKCLRCESEEAAEWQRLEAERAAAAAAAEADDQDVDSEPEIEELDPALLEQMYASLRGEPATDEFRQAREQLEAERRQRQAATLTGE